jgi:hypothetical protein
VIFFSFITTYLFLEETHGDKRHEPDRGREAGQWILSMLWGEKENSRLGNRYGSPNEFRGLLNDALSQRSTWSSSTLDDSLTACNSPTLCSDDSMDEALLPAFKKSSRLDSTTYEVFTKQVCMILICYGILALYVS